MDRHRPKLPQISAISGRSILHRQCTGSKQRRGKTGRRMTSPSPRWRQHVGLTRSYVAVAGAAVVHLLLIWSPIELKSFKRVIAHAPRAIDHVVRDVRGKLRRSIPLIVGHPRRRRSRDGPSTTTSVVSGDSPAPNVFTSRQEPLNSGIRLLLRSFCDGN